MKRRKNRMLSVLLSVMIVAGAAGCAGKETASKGQETDGLEQAGIESGDTAGTGQGKAENELVGDERPDPVVFSGEYRFAQVRWKKEQTQIKKPGGVLFDGTDLLVCDLGEHCVVRLTADGEFVERYGELGTEPGNFTKPTAIMAHEEEIYVLDSGNSRVQIFDGAMNYVREIAFEGMVLPEDALYIDMAVDGDGTIYLTNDSSLREAAHVYYIEDGELCAVEGECYGYLTERDGTVYAVDTFAFYSAEDVTHCRPGQNRLYQVGRDGLTEICELPYMYAPMDFVIGDDGIYTISNLWGQMNRFSMEGELSEALATVDGIQAHDVYLCMQDEDTFYAADTRGSLYRISRTGGASAPQDADTGSAEDRFIGGVWMNDWSKLATVVTGEDGYSTYTYMLRRRHRDGSCQNGAYRFVIRDTVATYIAP